MAGERVSPTVLFALLETVQVKYALDLLDRYRDPLGSTRMRVSLAGLMVLTAERIRDQGLPDWMQVCGAV